MKVGQVAAVLNAVLPFSLITLTLFAPSWSVAQNAKSRGSARPARQGQRLDARVQTQGREGQEADDQILIYRFRLDVESASSELIVSNPSAGEGTISLIAQEADGSFSKKASHTVEPGALFSISAADAGWSSTNVVAIKASRRLVLSIQFPDTDQPTQIARGPSVSIYDVFGFERQSEMASSEKRRGLSLLFSDGALTQELPRETSPQQGVSELLQSSGRSAARGLFVLQAN
jgi:hypothetical protein